MLPFYFVHQWTFFDFTRTYSFCTHYNINSQNKNNRRCNESNFFIVVTHIHRQIWASVGLLLSYQNKRPLPKYTTDLGNLPFLPTYKQQCLFTCWCHRTFWSSLCIRWLYFCITWTWKPILNSNLCQPVLLMSLETHFPLLQFVWASDQWWLICHCQKWINMKT